MSDFTDYDAKTEPRTCGDYGEEILDPEFFCSVCCIDLCGLCEANHEEHELE